MERLEVSYRLIADLRPRAGNPRTHTRKQVDQITASVQRFGFTNPVLIDNQDGIIAGHGRVEAAKRLGMTDVPTLRFSDMSEADVRAYVIADNRLAENAGWDPELLGIEFKFLSEVDFDFDLAITGFDLPEIDSLINAASMPETAVEDSDKLPNPGAGPAVTRLGDVWEIGQHRLICGDATSSDTYSALLGEEKAGMVFTDPPYNVPIEGHVRVLSDECELVSTRTARLPLS